MKTRYMFEVHFTVDGQYTKFTDKVMTVPAYSRKQAITYVIHQYPKATVHIDEVFCDDYLRIPNQFVMAGF